MPIGTPHGTLDYKQVSKVTFVGASSNTVIDTTTGSLGVGVGVGGPTSNLHVVGDALITGNVSDLNVVSNVNMLHTANTASIKLNSNVVAEFPRSKKLIKYPRVVIASGQSGLSGGYTQDGYTVKVSNESSTSLASYAFNGKYGDNDVTNAYWYTGNLNTYNGTPTGGYYVGTVNLGSDGGRAATVSGDWIELELPNKIKLEYFKYFSQNNSVNGAQDGVLYARNTTNEDWTLVHSYTDALVPDQNTAYTFNVNSTNYYKIYALVLTRKRPANTGTGGVAVGELEYFGVPEYDPEAHGTDVTVKSYPNVPNTDWLEVYYDAKDLDDGDVTNVDDLTPSGINDGTATNVTVSDGAFVFDGGTTTNITTTTATGMGGDNAFSISLWFNPTSQVGSVDNCLVTFGNKTSREQFLLTYNPNKLLAQFFGNGMNIDVPGGIQFGRWYHVVLTYPGGGHYNMSIYADGIKGSNNNGGTNLSGLIPTNAAVELGKYSNSYNEGFNGSIANFRLFNRVLTTDEIYQLYAYQKEDFGHSTNNMTLKAGRLGIGTSEPKAALDVRGDIHAVGSVNPVIGMWKQTINSTTLATTILTNIGSCMSTRNADGYGASFSLIGLSGQAGIFVAPYDGIYQFQAFLITQSQTSNLLLVFNAHGPSVDNNTWDSKNLINSYNELFDLRGDKSNEEEPITFTTLLNMSKGDYVDIQNHSAGYLGANSIRCSAFLLHRFS